MKTVATRTQMTLWKKVQDKAEGMRALINALQKHPLPVGEKQNVVLVTKVPPVPAPKGKKSRAT